MGLIEWINAQPTPIKIISGLSLAGLVYGILRTFIYIVNKNARTIQVSKKKLTWKDNLRTMAGQ